MEEFEKSYPLAMVAFGGARLRSDDPYYNLAQQLGGILAWKVFLLELEGVSHYPCDPGICVVYLLSYLVLTVSM